LPAVHDTPFPRPGEHVGRGFTSEVDVKGKAHLAGGGGDGGGEKGYKSIAVGRHHVSMWLVEFFPFPHSSTLIKSLSGLFSTTHDQLQCFL
jgi:hypothetical protein